MIVPNARFNCNGRITNVAASMNGWVSGTEYPVFQVWHPVTTSSHSSNYNKIGEVQLSNRSLEAVDDGSYVVYADISLNNSNEIEFRSGDVIGYYQPSNSRLI